MHFNQTFSVVIARKISSRFRYLKTTPDVSDDQWNQLKRQLKTETEAIINHFAGLAVKTMFALEKEGVTTDHLIALIEHSYSRNGNKLISELEKVTIMSKAFRVFYRFWSFFDYKILEIIIDSCCGNMKSDFDKYVKRFKQYCHRRVCEVPDDSLSKPEYKKTLCIKIDHDFINEIERMKLNDVEAIINNLEQILETNLRILLIEAGSIILTFHCLHEFDVLFPLSSKQEEELQKIGVVKIYMCSELFRCPPLPTKELSSKGISIACRGKSLGIVIS